jgi:hypothetical protein
MLTEILKISAAKLGKSPTIMQKPGKLDRVILRFTVQETTKEENT